MTTMLYPAFTGARRAYALHGSRFWRHSSDNLARQILPKRPIRRAFNGSSGSQSQGQAPAAAVIEGRSPDNDTNTNTETDGEKISFIPLIQEYDEQVSGGKLLSDALQQKAARKLTRLQIALNDYDHASFLDHLEQLEQYEERQHKQQQQQQQQMDIDENKKPPTEDAHGERPPILSTPVQIPRGFYIHGNVGTGKSLLLNKFYNSSHTLPTQTSTSSTSSSSKSKSKKKRRLHFHSFLQEIHQRIHTLNKKILNTHGRSFHINTSATQNPILQIAKQLSNEVTLLCIDEFQVTDVADAMILSQFFGELWRRGVVVVATSNRPPKDLYEGGLNRGYFLPFIDLMERYCVVHHLGNADGKNKNKNHQQQEETDYRRIRSGVDMPGSDKCGDYYHLIQDGKEHDTQVKMDQLFEKSSSQNHSDCANNTNNNDNINDNCQQTPLLLQVHFKRTISISHYHSNTIARFKFDELCTTELGSSDYNAIANHFQIIMIEDIPQLTLKYPDRARRFITLIDELYEAECCLVCSAVDTPDGLFVGKTSAEKKKDGGSSSTNPNRSSSTTGSDVGDDDGAEPSGTMQAVDVAQVQGTAVSELASVRELSFAFRRAASRMVEMCSKTWWEEKGVV